MLILYGFLITRLMQVKLTGYPPLSDLIRVRLPLNFLFGSGLSGLGKRRYGKQTVTDER